MTTFEAIKLMNKEQLAYVLAGAINTFWYIFVADHFGLSEEDVRSMLGRETDREMLENGKDIFISILDRPVDKEIEEIVAGNETTQTNGHESLEGKPDA